MLNPPRAKRALKNLLGELPLSAELYWALRQNGKPLNQGFSLRWVEKRLPELIAQAQAARSAPAGSAVTGGAVAGGAFAGGAFAGRKVALFATLRYWIEHAVLLGCALAGQGHQVSLAYLPYGNFRKELNRFDLRRQNLYARHVLGQAAPLIAATSLLDVPSAAEKLPPELSEQAAIIAERDVQYALQVEAIDRGSALYKLRLARNTQAAAAALAYLQRLRPDVVTLPNGSILEMGAVYQAARYLGIPVTTYEFGEQRGRIWLAHNAEVMRQETGELWQAWGDIPLSDDEDERIHSLFASRRQADLWQNFSRRWQGSPAQGGQRVRELLALDERPVVLLAANVIGDSLTLGRQVFTESMSEWLARTVQMFAAQTDAQLVVRVHPGERYTKGPSVSELVRAALPELPEHIHLVEAADERVNTYDLVELAACGLVYTTTTGMEMALSGVPVIVVGQTHYRGKGFTCDPASWAEFERMTSELLADPSAHRLSPAQVELAWRYYYRFFFDFPLPFPWHLLDYDQDLAAQPLDAALAPAGQAEFGEALRMLAGEPRRWRKEPA